MLEKMVVVVVCRWCVCTALCRMGVYLKSSKNQEADFLQNFCRILSSAADWTRYLRLTCCITTAPPPLQLAVVPFKTINVLHFVYNIETVVKKVGEKNGHCKNKNVIISDNVTQ